MYTLSLKFNRKIALALVCAMVLILGGLILICGDHEKDELAMETNSERLEYLEGKGWKIDESPCQEKEVIIPKTFSDVYHQYNQLQKSQGFDLEKYCGLEATIYSYTINNYKWYDGAVVADIYICEGKLIGGDIHSLELKGFMHKLCDYEELEN